MTFDYARAAATSLRLLTKFGQDVTLRSYSAGTYNPAVGTSTPTMTDTTRKGAIFDFGAGQTLERGTLIQVGDKRLLLDSVDSVSHQDHFIIKSIEYVIVSIGEINPAGKSVLFDIHIRR